MSGAPDWLEVIRVFIIFGCGIVLGLIIADVLNRRKSR